MENVVQRKVPFWGVLLLMLGLLGVGKVWAGGLGGGIDGFLAQWQAWAIGLGIVFFITGMGGWLNSKMGMFHAPVLDGTMNMFVPAGIFGAAMAIAGTLGLAAGGTLPL